METKTATYKSQSELDRGIKTHEKQGWSVQNIQTVNRGWGCGKTGCLGCLFLPLALFGRNKDHFIVIFSRQRV